MLRISKLRAMKPLKLFKVNKINIFQKLLLIMQAQILKLYTNKIKILKNNILTYKLLTVILLMNYQLFHII